MRKITLLNKLGRFKAVNNLKSNSSREIPNQFFLEFENGSIFQSYGSIIVVRLFGDLVTYLGDDWDYSVTTSKYRNDFCSHNTREIRDCLAGRNTTGKYEHVKGL